MVQEQKRKATRWCERGVIGSGGQLTISSPMKGLVAQASLLAQPQALTTATFTHSPVRPQNRKQGRLRHQPSEKGLSTTFNHTRASGNQTSTRGDARSTETFGVSVLRTLACSTINESCLSSDDCSIGSFGFCFLSSSASSSRRASRVANGCPWPADCWWSRTMSVLLILP